MKNFTLLAGAALALSLICAESAQAASLFSLAGPTPEFTSGIDPNHAAGDPNLVPNTFDVVFDSAGGVGAASFRLDAHGSIDGLNATLEGDEDDFTLSLNGVAILNGTWDLSGGGGNFLNALDPGATALPRRAVDFGGGGTVDIVTGLALKAGVNTLNFAFTTKKPLGVHDEGWDIRSLSVRGASAAPEPQAWALMLTGFLGVGAMVRRARGRIVAKMTPASLLRGSRIRA